MPSTFAEDIAARDLVAADPTDFDTPSTDALPNGDDATEFTATDSDATYAGASALDIPWGVSDFCVELWVKDPTSSPDGSNHWTCALHNSADTLRAWDVRQPGEFTRKQRLAIWNSDNSAAFDCEVIIPDTSGWHHCVFQINTSLGVGPVSGRYMEAWIDADLEHNPTLSTGLIVLPTLTGPEFSLGWSTAIVGLQVAKLAIYHRLLTPTEINDHYLAMTT